MGLDKEASGGWSALLLILMSVVLTGFNIYPSIVKWGGAGALVPITGFANSVAAPAIEFKSEGQVFGVGCKIFTIAGPVIPVSYTHLRAHETRHDLVCRLLLEKKKTYCLL